jgi:hypothetical protein
MAFTGNDGDLGACYLFAKAIMKKGENSFVI